mgnify:CR=1 FL=1
MRIAALKIALGISYLNTGFDIRKSAESRARFLSAKGYVARSGRSDGTDIVVSRDRITVYVYSSDPREHPCRKTDFSALRAFIKSRLEGHVRINVRPGVATLLEQILTTGKIDVMGYAANEQKHNAVEEDALNRVALYVHRSLALRVIESVFFRRSEI